jgi:hypothetical protein
MRSHWITHRGVEILYCDFTNFGRDTRALKAEVDAVDAEILSRPRGSVLAIADLTGTVTSTNVAVLFKESASVTAHHIAKQAVVGVSGTQKMLAQGVAFFSGQAMNLFNSVEDAKEWLAGASTDEGEKIVADIPLP